MTPESKKSKNNLKIKKKLLRKSTLETLLVKSKMFEELKSSNPEQYARDTAKAIQRLEFIVSKLSEHLINIFSLDNDEGSQDIELFILRAFLNCKLRKFESRIFEFFRF